MMLKEIALLFGRIGLLGFGGPIAVIAMIEEEFSRKRGWVSSERFSEIYAVCKILPGSVAAQVAIMVGRERAGVLGGIVAGTFYILPSFILVLFLSAAYLSSEAIRQSPELFIGFQAAALALIVASGVQLSRPYRSSAASRAVFLPALVVTWLNPALEPVLIAVSGIGAAWLVRRSRRRNEAAALGFCAAAGAGSAAAAGAAGLIGSRLAHAAAQAAVVSREELLLKLFWTGLKGGAFVFGTGLAIVPILEGDVVGRYRWMSHAQFMDGLALGQVTPGPALITTTFIGYVLAGFPGGFLMTFGVFFPGFINALLIVPRIWKRISGTPESTAFAKAAIPAVIGGIFATSIKLALTTLHDAVSIGIFVASLGIIATRRVPSWALILAAGIVGLLLATR